MFRLIKLTGPGENMDELLLLGCRATVLLNNQSIRLHPCALVLKHNTFATFLASTLLWSFQVPKMETFGNAVSPILVGKLWGYIVVWMGKSGDLWK